MNMKLYQIDQAIENFLINNVDEETGEILNFEELEALQIAREDKLEAIACAYKNLIAEAEAIKSEKENLSLRQKRTEREAENCKKYLEYALQGEKLKTAKVSVSYRKSEVVILQNGIKLSNEYLTYKLPEPNKTAIKNALKTGLIIDGCSLEQKLNIQIK